MNSVHVQTLVLALEARVGSWGAPPLLTRAHGMFRENTRYICWSVLHSGELVFIPLLNLAKVPVNYLPHATARTRTCIRKNHSLLCSPTALTGIEVQEIVNTRSAIIPSERASETHCKAMHLH
jgi:hypothetical protein